jgi:Tol biopolymer transport system component
MKKLIVAISLIVFASCSQQENKPATYSMAEFMDIISINGGSFSPDETKILFNSRETGIFNAVEIDLNTGEQKARTQSTTDAIMSEGYFPEDNRFLYISDRGGNEISHIYVQNPEGNVTDLISDSTAKAVFYGWSYDRKKMYYASNSRDSRFFDLYQVKVGGNEKEGQVYVPAQIYKNEKGLNVAAISNDDRYLALV